MSLLNKVKTFKEMNRTFRLLMFLAFVTVICFLSCEKPERYVKLEALEIPEADISYTYAVLKGEIIDIGSIQISDHGIVYTEAGTPVLGVSPGLHLGQIVKKGVFQDTIKGLKRNTTYYFRVYVIVDGEAKYSNNTPKFKTKDTKLPTITAGSITDITMTSASVSGEVTFDGGEPETIRGLCWGTSENPTLSNSIDTTVIGSGKGPFNGVITGLAPGTLYYLRTYATNSKGTAYNDADVVFKTHNLPKVTTTAFTAVTNTGATSGGDVTDDGDVEVTARGVCWGTSPSPTTELTTKTSDGSGKGTFISTITGLTPLTTYFVRAYATNKYGTSYGEERSVTATKPPSVLTKAATLIGNTTATLNANINAQSFSTTVTFEYGTSTSYGSSVTAIASPVSGTTATDVLANVTLLSPGTTYHFRVKAESTGGTTYGEDLTFTTLQPPSATTTAATNVITTSATLNGTVNANNSSTSVSFEYGPTTGYGSSVTATPSTLTGNTSTDVTASLTGLTEGTVYHYRVRAISDGGTVYGEDVIITSLAPPVATTSAATLITGSTATLNATVNAKGLSTTVEFEYGTSTSYGTSVTAVQSPVTGNSDTPVSIGLTSLAAGTTYHFRVKVTSTAGTIFASDLTFSTLNDPTITTTGITYISSSSATGGGNIISNGGSEVTASGVCWSTSANPTTSDQKTIDGTGTGSFASTITGLTAGTTYHVRAYATNSVGTAYGDDVTFVTSSATLTDIDGNTYNTIVIGTQTWMAENLKTTKYRDGTNIPNITDNASWGTQTEGAYCWYNNDITSNKNVYGAIYNFFTTINNRKLCPTGWHVPTDAEWGVLINYLGGLSTAGGKMKESGTTHWSSPNTDANNQSGFTSLPGGFRQGGLGTFHNIGTHANWWSSTPYDPTGGWFYNNYYSNGAVVRDNVSNNPVGFSVRCIQGEGQVLPAITTTSATSITSSGASSGGNITSDGGASITAKGVCWSTSANPTTSDQKTIDGTGTGSFTSTVTGLTAGTTYYVRAYATNSVGTAYGDDVTFVTSSATLTDIDGNTYNTIVIGTQTWMAENLKTTKYRNGDLIGTTTPTTLDIQGESTPKYEWAYSGNESNVATYGRLYTWHTVTDNRIVCPTGWHVPTDADWTTLTDFLGGLNLAGGKLKETGTTHWSDPNTGATNESGFSALPGGQRYNFGTFGNMGSYGRWWSSTEASITTGYYRSMSFNDNLVYSYSYVKQSGFSVRCIQGEGQVLPAITTTSATSITSSGASSGGNIISDGGASITAKGVCWSTNPNPTIGDPKTSDGTGTGPFTSSITGLASGTTYHVRAYATNSVGTTYGNDMVFIAISIGDNYLGGKVAYILQSGDPGYISGETHGLIATPSDQSTGIQWYNGVWIACDVIDFVLGTGNANTNAIVTVQGAGSYAAQICYDLVLGGYSDWYLPSRDELNKLYLNKAVIGGFASNLYWSSSEDPRGYPYSAQNACGQNFSDGTQDCTYSKAAIIYVRAVRAF
jgi:uncharacterized protein (TIGR02145 family)